MADTLTRAPARDDLDAQGPFDMDERDEVQVMDGPAADDVCSLLPSSAIERFEAFTAVHGRRLTGVGAIDALAASPTVDRCVRRFAAAEADVSDPSLDGLGRVSGARVARVGGLLHGKVPTGSAAELMVRTAVEQTIRAGYLAAVLTQQVSAVPVRDLDADELWHALLRLSYRVPRDVAAATWQLCGLDEFWVDVLDQAGLERDASRVAAGAHTPLSRGIRGLASVGVALAIAERGGRRDRRDGLVRRRPTRSDRRRGSVPAAPRAAVD